MKMQFGSKHNGIYIFLLFISLLLLSSFKNSYKTAKFTRLHLIQKDSCLISLSYLDLNNHIQLRTITPLNRHDLYIEKFYVSDLIFYGKKISLDSIYLAQFSYKRVYLPVVTNTIYYRTKFCISIDLYCIDEALNSFNSNLHVYHISFSMKKLEITSINLKFLGNVPELALRKKNKKQWKYTNKSKKKAVAGTK